MTAALLEGVEKVIKEDCVKFVTLIMQKKVVSIVWVRISILFASYCVTVNFVFIGRLEIYQSLLNIGSRNKK